ncbi:PE family protein [Mycobacterium asiaticum]|uniref:PE domain-containing protein n=2 Tax=Mycobacterium asiaticum TaxID=1790 RepID=A0A1A3KMK3_MYCAS|nr:PE family protein [Mycobacterium asiaticum]OBJ86260.1 hypothetical protein A5640_01210 [Mycobacterium asiaticum]
MASLVIAAPEALATAAADLGQIGDAIRLATAAAAPLTIGILPAAADEVSAAIGRLFGTWGAEFQALNAQTALWHAEFARLVQSGGHAYAMTEAAAVSSLGELQQTLQALAASPFTPIKDLTGRPLFGNGANGVQGTGQAGGAGGWL